MGCHRTTLAVALLLSVPVEAGAAALRIRAGNRSDVVICSPKPSVLQPGG